MFIEQASEEEIFNIIRKLKSNKSPGYDGIRPKDLKNNASIFAPIITCLINQSILSATIPTTLKTAIIRPIYKSGQKDNVNNYRPISILPVIEKIFEEIIVKRLNTFLCKYNIINKNQYGFQKNKNINQLLGNFANTVNTALSNVEHCLVLFIDFSKAFDTLSHTKLLEILARNGIRGNVLMWINDYLNLRKYRVKINNKISDEILTDHGVPQGSKLGPILYLLYANDLLNTLSDCYKYAYADDTAIIVTNKDIETATITMQQKFIIICKWCHDNGLVINASKTKIMHIRQPNMRKSNIKLKYHDIDCIHSKTTDSNDTCATYIELVSCYEYLGVHVDDTFKWKIHINELQKKLRKAAFSLYHLSYSATYGVLRQAYFALAESYIRHGIAAWGSSAHCKMLQHTQNRVLKILWKKQNHYNFNNWNNYRIDNPIFDVYNNTLQTNNSQQANETTYDNSNNNVNSSNHNNLRNYTSVTNNDSTNINMAHRTTNSNFSINYNTNIYDNRQTNNIVLNRSDEYINLANNNTARAHNHNSNISKNLPCDLKILNIKSIYRLTILTEFNYNNILQRINHRYNTRLRLDGRFRVNTTRSSYGDRTLAVILPKIYNELPVNLLDSINPINRKKLFKNYFLNSQ